MFVRVLGRRTLGSRRDSIAHEVGGSELVWIDTLVLWVVVLKTSETRLTWGFLRNTRKWPWWRCHRREYWIKVVAGVDVLKYTTDMLKSYSNNLRSPGSNLYFLDFVLGHEKNDITKWTIKKKIWIYLQEDSQANEMDRKRGVHRHLRDNSSQSGDDARIFKILKVPCPAVTLLYTA